MAERLRLRYSERELYQATEDDRVRLVLERLSRFRSRAEGLEKELGHAIQQKLDETEGMKDPDRYHMLRVKMLSLISALRAPPEEEDNG